METLLLKAATTVVTDQGIFSAVISTATVDRERDIVDPNGFVKALQKWVPLGKRIPLLWHHGTAAADRVGYIDPASAEVKGHEVVASGKIDFDTAHGPDAWKGVKSGALGFSFGFLVLPGGARARKGGGKHILDVDVFEVTATWTPMQPDTRVLDYKAIKGHADVGPAARHHLEGLIKYYMGKPHPFGSCVEDNTRRFGPEGADKVCATLKDLGFGSTHWRNRGKALADAVAAPANDEPTQDDLDSMCQALYDAAGGDLEQLLEMWHEHMQANGDQPKALSPDELRAEAEALSRKHALRGAHKQAGDDDATESPVQAVQDAIEELQEFIDQERQEGDTEDVATAQRLVTGLRELLQREESQEPAETPEPAKSTAKAVRDQVNEIMRHMGKSDAGAKAVLELETLRGEHAEQTTRLERAEEELATARKQLTERTADLDTLKRAGDALTLDAVKNHRRREHKAEMPDGAEWLIPEGELDGAKSGSLKAVWTTAYVNNLPDSSFLHVESGGEKDSDGKTTPRSLRHFPYKDASGAIDTPHLRNALSRIPQSNLPSDVKDKLAARAQNILDNQKALVVDPNVTVDVTGKEHQGARPVDPLVQQAKAIAVQWRGHGVSRPKPPRSEEPAPRPEFDENELRREMRALMVNALSGTNRS